MSLPKYQQIATDLRARIGSGEYPPGSMLPTQNELAGQYKAAPNTVKSALMLLRVEGVIETAQGVAGALVLKPPWRERLTMSEVAARLERLERHVFGEDG